MKGSISVSEFTEYLKDNNMIIVHKSMVNPGTEKRLLRKNALSIAEIGKLKQIKKSRTAIYQLIKKGRLKEGKHWMQDSKGTKKIFIDVVKQWIERGE